jgi:U3 small nucleolar ribonucleoprotein protein IMP4
MDDEYARAGTRDPQILLTTSRNPSSRLTQFAKELRLVFPNSQRINRGGTVIKELVEAARNNDVTDIVIVHEHRGEPDGVTISHMPYGPTAFFNLSSCVLRHDIKDRKVGTMSEAYPHLVFDNFSTPLGTRTQSILKYLFPVPKTDARRVMTFANRDDTVSFRHHTFKKAGGKGDGGEVDLAEVGPRFEMKLYQIRLGTIDMTEAENEWVLRPYMNSAKKRKVL